MPAIPTANLQQAMTAIEEQVAQASSIGGIRFRRFKPQLDEIEQIVNNTITVATADLSDDECGSIIDRVSTRRGSLALKTGVTTEVIGICKQVLAFGIAGIALAVGFLDKLKTVLAFVLA